MGVARLDKDLSVELAKDMLSTFKFKREECGVRYPLRFIVVFVFMMLNCTLAILTLVKKVQDPRSNLTNVFLLILSANAATYLTYYSFRR